MRHFLRRKNVTLTLVVALGAVFAACQPEIVEVVKEVPVEKEVIKVVEVEAKQETGPRQGGQLVAFASNDPGSADPAAFATWDQGLVVPNVVEGLLRLSPDGTAIDPAVAETYSSNDAGDVWTFNLRSGATFHNGDAVTASDFKYSFERLLSPDMAAPKAWLLSGVVGAAEYQAGSASEISGVKVVDDQTLEISLTEALGYFPAIVANPALGVVSERAVDEFGEDFGQNVVSTGPFKLGEWNINDSLTLDANDDYWGGRPYLDSVKFRVIGDENTRVLEFDSKALDITWVPPAHWNRFVRSDVFADELGWAHTFHTDFFVVNMDREPFGSSAALRTAMCHGIDREAVIASLQGRAGNAQGLLPPGLLGHDADASICTYDPDAAMAVMAEGGYADGVDGSYDLILPNWGNMIKIMEIYQAQLAQIGININVVPTEYGPWLEALGNGNFDLAWNYRVADYADPDSFYYPMLHSGNIGGSGNQARYSNSAVDDLVNTGRSSVESTDRVAAYRNIDAMLAKDLPYIPLTHNIYVDVKQPYVEGYIPSPVDMHVYQHVWISDETK